MIKHRNYFLIAISIFLIFAEITYAYVDPGSFYAFFQLVLASAIGGIIFARSFIQNYFRKIFDFLKKK